MTKRRSTRSTSSSSATASPQTDKILAVTAKKKSSLGSKTKTASKKRMAKIDSMKPKKPPTAFFYFMVDFRKEYQEQNPNVKSMRDVGKACGVKWKTMTYEEKVKYYDIATEKRAEFDMAMAEFIKRKDNGEFDESEGDSEFDE